MSVRGLFVKRRQGPVHIRLGLPILFALVLIASPAFSGQARSAWLGTSGIYRFTGAGFGHAVGMSQYGSKGMAEAGYGAGQILGHYYQGTAIAPMPQPNLRVHITDISYAPSGLSFYTSSTVIVTVDGTGIYNHVYAPTTGPPAVFSSDGSFLYLSQGPNLIQKTAGTFVLRYDPALEPGIGSLVQLNPPNERYRYGRVEVTRQAAVSKVRAVIKDIPMEKYLYGLGEVPNSWPIEAQRAQAIAGRTYALEKVTRLGQNRDGCSCGLYSSVRDQNYEGYEKEARASFESWKNAVDSTAGLTVTYDGRPIEAYYSSSSGGHTENSENVFFAALPYLRGVRDPWDEAVSPYRVWQRAFTGSDLQRWLNARSDTNIGTLFGIEIRAPYGVSGRILRPATVGGVRLLSSSGPHKDVDPDTFRSAVNAGLSAEGRSGEHLRSSLFQLGSEPFPHGFRGGVFVAGRSGSETVVTGADAGGGPEVVVSDRTGGRIGSFFAYDLGWTGGVRVALCDLNGDSTEEIVTSPGPGGGPHIKVFTTSGAFVSGFFAYAINFTGGAYIACANVDGSPGDEIVTGAGPGGGPHVRVFDSSGNVLNGFFPYDVGFKGGVRVAAGDLLGDSKAEIVTGAGPTGGPHVKVFDASGAPSNAGFFPYPPTFTGGVYIATISGPAGKYVVTGIGEGGGSHVRVMKADGEHVWESFAFGGPMNNGARVAGANGVVVAATGPGAWPVVKLVP